MSTPCVSTLYSHVTTSHITSRKKRTQRRSSWAEFLGRMAHHTTSHQITHHKPKEENTKKKLLGRVLGPDGSPHHISPDHTSQAERRENKEEVLGPSSWAGWHSHHITHHHISPHHTSQAERSEHEEEVLGPSSWAGWLTTPHLTRSHITSRKKRTQRRSSWAEFLGRMAHHTTSHQITHHKPKEENTKKKLLGRVLGPDGSPHHISPYHTSQAERRENKEEVLGPSSWAGWHSHHITHHHISPHQTSQAESAKKYEFYYENPVKDHPRPTKSTRITTKNENRRS